jgi:hypothetical protein
MNLDIIHDKLSIVRKIYFQLLIQRNGKLVSKFSAIWTPMAPWFIGYIESSSIHTYKYNLILLY